MADWEWTVNQWSHPPVDDVAYMSALDLLAMEDKEFLDILMEMRRVRFGGWRNHGGLWMEKLKLRTTERQDVMDFGCGVGVEVLEYATGMNRVVAADIAQQNVDVAARLCDLFGLDVEKRLVTDRYPFVEGEKESLDVFHCNGVLHHIRWPQEIVRRAWELLRPGGELRLMVYSDRGWRQAVGDDPPSYTEGHPEFEKFVRHFDAVGDYADWYDREKIERLAGDMFSVEDVEYITPEGLYLVAVLKKEVR